MKFKKGDYVLIKKKEVNPDYQDKIHRLIKIRGIRDNILKGNWFDNGDIIGTVWNITHIERKVKEEEAEQMLVENEI